jgi:uncharacterized damage-inducible protein DinB
MNLKDARALLAYDRWANRRLLAAASVLAPEDFVRDLRASLGSVRGTLLHILWGEQRWVRFWQDGTFLPDPQPDAFGDAAALQTLWSSLEHDHETFAALLTDDGLAAPCRVRDDEYSLGELVQHMLNHSTYHRGQVALMLRQLGETPPATDYRVFLNETRQPGAA